MEYTENITIITFDAQGYELPDPTIIESDSAYWDRFSVTPTGCWVPRNTPHKSGYILTSVEGRMNVYLHRESFERYHNRPIKPEHEIHHMCKNRTCGNPMHLQELTREEHMIADGIMRLTNEQTIEIHTRARAGERTAVLADEFGVSDRYVRRLREGSRKMHVLTMAAD